MEELIALLPSEDRENFKTFFQNNSMPGFDVTEIQGYRLYPGFAADGEVEYAYNEWNIRKNDVFIASFPKTGEALMVHYLACLHVHFCEICYRGWHTLYYFPVFHLTYFHGITYGI